MNWNPEYMPSVAEMFDEIASRSSTPVHPGGACPSFAVPRNDVETRFDSETGTITVQCYRNNLPTDSQMRYTLAAARKTGTVKRMVVMILQSTLQDDPNQGAWLASKHFSRDISHPCYGGQLVFVKQWEEKGRKS